MDGGAPGVVGVHNALGILARSPAGLEVVAEVICEAVATTNIADPRLLPIKWRPNVKRRLKIGFYHDNGIFALTTPGMKRALDEAIEFLKAEKGHKLIPFYPRELLEYLAQIGGRLSSANQGQSLLELLDGSPIDEDAIGFVYR